MTARLAAGGYKASRQAVTTHMIILLTYFAMSSIITQGQRARRAPVNLQAGTIHSGSVHLGVQITGCRWWDNPALITFCQKLSRDVVTEVKYRGSHLSLHFLIDAAINLDKLFPGRRKYAPIHVPPACSTPHPMQMSIAKTAHSDTINVEIYHIHETIPPKFQ